MRIAVLSTGRQDWGILRGICTLLRDDDAFDLRLILGGMHNAASYGDTGRLVIEEGFTPCEKLSWIPNGGPTDPAHQAADALWMTAEALQRQRPDAFMIVGDRFETASSALGATLAKVPIIHLHGGEETTGAMDNAFRHSITKLSHLHFTSHPEHTARVVALGEDPTTVHTVGAPGLDNLHRPDLPDRDELESWLGMKLAPPVVLVTLHPATLLGNPQDEAAALVGAMDMVPATYVITLPNSDPGNEAVRAALKLAALRPARTAVEAMGERRYWGLMRVADAMLGNSSSAIIEAPALGLPAVNIGDRQKGRIHGGNIIHAAPTAPEIADALRHALSPEFQRKAKLEPSPFGHGDASMRILKVLRRWTPPSPPVKWTVPVAAARAMGAPTG